jgi:hypothetical protein
MANEISVTLRVAITNGNMSEVIQPNALSITQNAMGGPTPGYQTIGTTEETISLSELGTIGVCYIRNNDATNFVDFGVATTSYMIRLKAGEFAWIRLKPGSTIYAKADTAACKVTFKAFED